MDSHAGLHAVFEMILLVSAASVLLHRDRLVKGQASPFIAASFVFGDSLVDAGNNNYIYTRSRANFPQYGIDFPPGNLPTGRFTNGLTIPDIIGQSLGLLRYAMPYLAPSTNPYLILNGGINYASGGGGILNETGTGFIGRLSLHTQATYFQQTMETVRRIIGIDAAAQLMSKSIISITIGSNDFMDNDLLLVPPRNHNSTDVLQSMRQTFTDKLMAQYGSQFMRMYDAGARKFVLVGVPPVGCTPYLRILNLQLTKCVDRFNEWALSFNLQVKKFASTMTATLEGANVVYADAYHATLDILGDYLVHGFEEIMRPCCGRGLNACGASSPVCANRSAYFFWDVFHPTQAAYELIANKFLHDPNYAFPMTVVELASI